MLPFWFVFHKKQKRTRGERNEEDKICRQHKLSKIQGGKTKWEKRGKRGRKESSEKIHDNIVLQERNSENMSKVVLTNIVKEQ